MTAHAPETKRPVEVERQMTADEFLAYFLNDVAAEAELTETNNENRTLGDYLADLATRCERIIEGEVTVTDPLIATRRPIDRWVRGDVLARVVTDLIGPDPEHVHAEYVGGAWEVALAALGALNDTARGTDDLLGGAATFAALNVATQIVTDGRA